jgi:hypothetical protein
MVGVCHEEVIEDYPGEGGGSVVSICGIHLLLGSRMGGWHWRWSLLISFFLAMVVLDHGLLDQN